MTTDQAPRPGLPLAGFIAVELAYLAIAHIWGGPPWTVVGMLAFVAPLVTGLRRASLVLLVPSLAWLVLFRVTGNRELFFPFAMYVAAFLAARRPAGGRGGRLRRDRVPGDPRPAAGHGPSAGGGVRGGGGDPGGRGGGPGHAATTARQRRGDRGRGFACSLCGPGALSNARGEAPVQLWRGRNCHSGRVSTAHRFRCEATNSVPLAAVGTDHTAEPSLMSATCFRSRPACRTVSPLRVPM